MALLANITFPAQADLVPTGIFTRPQYLDFSMLCWSCGMVVCCFGVFTNFINIKTFIAMGVKDGVTALFLALSFSDFLYVFFTTIRNAFMIIFYIENILDERLLPVHPYAVAIFADNSAYPTYNVSALTSTFLAVARCMCVVRPLQFKHVFTRRRCLIALFIISCFPYACWVPVLAEMGLVRKFDEYRNISRLNLWTSPQRERVKDVAQLILSIIIPLVNQTLLVLCVPAMVVKLREGAKFRTSNSVEGTGKDASSSKLSGRDRQVVEQVVLISIIYMAMNVPIILITFLSSFDPRFDYGKVYEYFFRFSHTLGNVFESINSSVNIFVYYFYNSKFRSLCFSFRKVAKN